MTWEMSLRSGESSAIVIRDEKSKFLADAIFGTHEKVALCSVESLVRVRESGTAEEGERGRERESGRVGEGESERGARAYRISSWYRRGERARDPGRRKRY